MGAIKPKQQLHIISQLGSWVIASEEIRHQTSGIHRGKPAFRLSRRRIVDQDGEKRSVFRIDALVEGLILKSPGAPEKKAAAGDYWELEDTLLAESNVRLGRLIWCFRWAAVPLHMSLAADNPGSWLKTDEESEKFRRLSTSLAISLFLLLSLLQFMPEFKQEPKVLYSETVTLVVPKASKLGGIDTRPIQRPRTAPVEMAEEAVAQPSLAPPDPNLEKSPKDRPAKGKLKPLQVTKATTGPSTKPAPGTGESLKAKALKNELTAALSTLSRSSLTPNQKAGAPGDAIGKGDSILSAIRGQSGGTAQGLRLSGAPGGTKDPREVALGGQGSGVSYGKGVHAAVSGQGTGMVSMDLGGLRVNQGLTRDEVGAVIQRHMDEIRYCYESAKVHSSFVEGKLQTAFTINSGGVVSTAKVVTATMSNAVLEDCVLRKLKSWKFPKPRGGVQVDVNYPFVFRTLGTPGYD